MATISDVPIAPSFAGPATGFIAAHGGWLQQNILWVWLRLALGTPSSWLCLLTILAFWQLIWSGRRLGAFLVMPLWLILAFLPVGDWAIAPLEVLSPQDRIPAGKTVDGVVILGGDEHPLLSAIHGAPVLSGGRLMTGAALAYRYPSAKIVFAGGHSTLGTTGPLTESDVAAQFFTSLGIKPSRIFYDKQSIDTHENAVNSWTLAHPAPNQTWLLVTSAWHMPRAMLAFQRAGWIIAPYPSDWLSDPANFRVLIDLPENLGKLDRAVHEYAGLFAYWINGYSERLLPQAGGG